MRKIQFQKNRILISDDEGNSETWAPMREPSFEVGAKFIRYSGNIYFLR